MRFLFVWIFFLLYLTDTGLAQTDVNGWHDSGRRKGQLLKFLPTNDLQTIYALRWSGGRMFGNYMLTKHDDLNFSSAVKVRMNVDKAICSYVGADLYNENPVVFLSDIINDSNVLYMRVYSPSLKQVEKEVRLAGYAFEKGRQKGLFGVRFSPDKRFMAVIWEKPGKKNNEHVYGYRMFDQNLTVLHEGEYQLPYQPDLSDIQGYYVSNAGDYFIAVTEYEIDPTKVLYRNQRYFKSLHLYHLNETGLLDYEVNLDGRKIYTVSMSSAESSLVNLTGLYGNRDEAGIRGVFYQTIDLKSEKEIAGGFCELKTDIITEGWSDRAKKRLKRREERGKEESIFFNYEMRESIINKDSTIVGAMEQHYIQERMTDMQQSGLSSNTFYYYYNDVIVYRIAENSDFDWIKKIRKYQVSTNDGGPYSGYIGYYDSSSMYLLFNDHIDNYDSLGNYIEADEVYLTNYGKRNNVVAFTKVNLTNGKVERKILHKRSEVNFVFIPKLCINDRRNNRVLLYGIKGQREFIKSIPY